MPVSCTICGLPLLGWPDDDVTCMECEWMNFSGNALRHPERPTPPLPWWQRERLALAPRRDGLRALTFIQGPWTWAPEHGIEEREDGA